MKNYTDRFGRNLVIGTVVDIDGDGTIITGTIIGFKNKLVMVRNDITNVVEYVYPPDIEIAVNDRLVYEL